MNLKKLLPELVEGLKIAGFDKAPKAIQTNSLPAIKSGSDLFMIAPSDLGKSTAFLIGVIQQLKEEFEEAPRAIVMAPSKDAVHALEKQFNQLACKTSLRVFSVFEQGEIKHQKDLIFDGIDVLIGTPLRITELIKKNGIPFANVKMIIVDDAHEFRTSNYFHIYSIIDKAPKAQVVIAADSWNKNFEKFEFEIMKNPKLIDVKEE